MKEMKKIIILLTTLMLFGCSPANNATPSETTTPTDDPPIETTSPQATEETDTLPLASIGIFTDTNDPTLFCIITVNVHQSEDDYNTIDMQPIYDFYNAHTDLIEAYSYYGTYEDEEGEMLTAMGFTPQSLKDYDLHYYYNYYKVDPSITEEFLDTVHAVLAKYGTRIEEGENIPINFIEDSIEFKSYDNTQSSVDPLTLSYNENGYDYYLINDDEHLYLKVKDDLNDVFTVAYKDSEKLYGIFYPGDVFTDCIWGRYISDTAYTHHAESGGWSYATEQLSDNLRIAAFPIYAQPLVSDPNVQDAIDNFNYECASLVIVE